LTSFGSPRASCLFGPSFDLRPFLSPLDGSLFPQFCFFFFVKRRMLGDISDGHSLRYHRMLSLNTSFMRSDGCFLIRGIPLISPHFFPFLCLRHCSSFLLRFAAQLWYGILTLSSPFSCGTHPWLARYSLLVPL